MANSTTIAFGDLHPTIKGGEFPNHGCFGAHNSFSQYRPVRHDGRDERNHFTRELTSQMEVIEFWPHVSEAILNRDLRIAVDIFNSIGCYSDLFWVTPANSIGVNLREHPADKVFTAFMMIRDQLYGHNDILTCMFPPELPKEDFLLRKRIALFLRIAGFSMDMFGRVTLSSNVSAGAESCATHVPNGTDALAAYLFIFGSKEQCADCWAQEPVGVGDNYNGYIRDWSDRMNSVRTRRGYDPNDYGSISRWLYAWSKSDGHKDPQFDEKRRRLTVGQLLIRLRDRLASLATASDSEKSETIINVFDEIKDMYS